MILLPAVFAVPLATGWAAGWLWIVGPVGAAIVVGSILWATREGD